MPRGEDFSERRNESKEGGLLDDCKQHCIGVSGFVLFSSSYTLLAFGFVYFNHVLLLLISSFN
jgi:hypothetical protein